MYSIYDYYGMQNDIDNRYKSGQQQGAKTNTPFLSMMPKEIPTSSVANSGASERPGSLSNSQDYFTEYGIGPNDLMDKDTLYGNTVDWSQHPSPQVFQLMIDYGLIPAFTMGAGVAGTAAGGPLGGWGATTGIKTLFDYMKHQGNVEEGKTNTNFNWGNSIYGNALKSAVDRFVPNPTISNNPVVNALSGLLSGGAKNNIVEYATNPHKNTNPFTTFVGWLKGFLSGEEESDTQNLAEETNRNDYVGGANDPYGAVGPDSIGGNGRSDTLGNDISGYDWSWGDY